MRRRVKPSRQGIVLVLLLVSLVMLLTFVALAIDMGMIAVARTQLQDAADAGAMAGARALNGQTGNNYSQASPNAVGAATANTVLAGSITSGNVTVDIGRYVYVSGNQRFEGQFPGPSTENWSLVRTTVTSDIANRMAFSRVLNFTGTNIRATATAVHRPRDVTIILDYSGSMRYASLMGIGDGTYSATDTPRHSNNPDTVYPTFGHYTATSTAALQGTSYSSPWDQANATMETADGRDAIVGDFYSDALGTRAFTAASSGYASTPGGDNWLRVNKHTGGTYAYSARDLLNTTNTTTKDTTWETTNNNTSGYRGITGVFNGYTQGPSYWGKTFFVWPPDPTWNTSSSPQALRDWRRIYFGTNNNQNLWDSSGNWRTPGGSSYTINYSAILNFIKNVGTNPFPSSLRSGRIVYYTAIPNSISSGFPPSNLNERFWKDYIDYVIGLMQTGSSSWTEITNAGYVGYGPDYSWTSGSYPIRISAPPTGANASYMDYRDNPKRPRTRFWFGPMTMLDFLGNFTLEWYVSPKYSRYTYWPGTCHESPMYGCKLGIRAALQDISNNHPNDLVSLSFFSEPKSSSTDTGRFNRVRVGLSRNYSNMQESLWYPPATVGTTNTVTPYDSNNVEVPRACGYTCYSMGLMQAYNQFSANTTLLNYNTGATAGDAGGNGRKGAQKIVIFETDGQPNTLATASLTNLGPYNSYYQIRYNSANPAASEFPSVSTTTENASTVVTQINNICTQLCALDTANPPGYSSAAKKCLIHCIGFGPVFATGAATRAGAIATLNGMQVIGGVNDGMPSYKIIYGTETQVTTALQQAFTQILQQGVQISLVQ